MFPFHAAVDLGKRATVRVSASQFSFVLALVLLLWAHLPFWSPASTLLAIDEGYIAAFAWRMVEGSWLPYVDAVSLRGPLTYYLAAIATAIVGPGTFLPIRIIGFAVIAVVPVFIYRACVRAGYPEAGGVAALAYVYPTWFTFPLTDGFAYNGENVLNAFAMAGLPVLVLAMRRPAFSGARLFFAGALSVGAGMGKQVGVLVPLVFGLWVLAAAIGRRELDAKQRIRAVGLFVAGGITPVAILMAVYIAAGELKTLVYCVYTYGVENYVAPFTPQMIREHIASFVRGQGIELGIGASVAVWMLLFRLWGVRTFQALARRYEEHGFACTVAIGAITSVIGAKMGIRHFGHYYMQIVPWFALVVGIVVADVGRAWSRDDRSPQLTQWLLLTPGLLMVVAQLFAVSVEYGALQREGSAPWWMDPYKDPVCDVVRQHSAEGDTLFVWGFEPWHYIDCNRKPASRYVYTTFISGFVPWFMDERPEVEETRVIPHSRDIVLRELAEAKPPMIIEAPIGWRSMDRYPQIWAFVDREYCVLGHFYGRRFFVRRDHGRCPAPALPPVEPESKRKEDGRDRLVRSRSLGSRVSQGSVSTAHAAAGPGGG